ncbi:hypothetical protein AB4Y45_35445 [Paraburkholderia sp. EG287A]|uniref:hypothetical protein n=1 Tax=Paraburkholderia sp. EG287A TaxID=3237012 RepID=UPI0034D1EFA7
MGEAKRRREAEAARTAALRPAIERVGIALRKLATAASTNLGSDCYLHASLGRELLGDFGFDARIVAGEAAWRVGDGDEDFIGHTPRVQGFAPSNMPHGKLAAAYHAWLIVEGNVVDFTTYQLPRKASALDALDGGNTTVSWAPDVFVLPVSLLLSYRQARLAPKAGVAFYDVIPGLAETMASTYEPDPENVAIARFIMANPDVNVFGPNQVREAGEE